MENIKNGVECRNLYHKTKPEQLGNLHQRMQYAMTLARENEIYSTNRALWWAIVDLQAEVSFYSPASPPHACRPYFKA